MYTLRNQDYYLIKPESCLRRDRVTVSQAFAWCRKRKRSRRLSF
ncbi:hypothetical protein NC99_09830 [Sunxiuqinia dokdonensis]|uniref:Uncharacterized protein n=1 Tax=Sunxiuqinia dokdonensis TaxID=1409788 RepID=A0A0L8VCL6_9BACT|nr:hypothetical protein NC99_09830 [Sunxiuqinia dokdonensis]